MLTIKEENNHDHITWCRKVKVKVTQLCPTLCNPMGLVHGILQARLLEWVSFPFSRGSSQPRDWTQVFYIAGGFLTSWATRKAQEYWIGYPIPSPADLPNPGIDRGLLRCRQILYQLSYHGNPSEQSTYSYVFPSLDLFFKSCVNLTDNWLFIISFVFSQVCCCYC